MSETHTVSIRNIISPYRSCTRIRFIRFYDFVHPLASRVQLYVTVATRLTSAEAQTGGCGGDHISEG